MRKKGVIVIQFNWIYVLIIGGLILGLFVGIAVRQKEASEKTAAGEIQRRLETVLASAESSLGTVNMIDMGRATIRFDCFGFSVGELKPFSPGVTFAPKRISTRGKEFITWTQDFSVPFRVTNFLYVTGRQVRYVIVGDSQLADKIKEELPRELNMVSAESLVEAETITYENEDITKFIIVDLDGSLDLDSSFLGTDVSALQIKGITINFYEKPPNSAALIPRGASTYYGSTPMMYGAIFADDAETFDCNMEKAFKRLDIISQIYARRAEELRDSGEYGEEHPCYNSYNSASYWFQTINTDLVSAATNLQSINRALQINSCPLLY
jgi:hypothetical protein